MKIKVSKGYRAFTALNTLLMILLVLITAYPIYYCLVASFSDPAALERNAGKVLLAPFTPLTVGAYGKVLHHRLFLSGCRNTLIVLAAGTALNMLLTVAAGGPRTRKGCLQRRRSEYFAKVAQQGSLHTRLALTDAHGVPIAVAA